MTLRTVNSCRLSRTANRSGELELVCYSYVGLRGEQEVFLQFWKCCLSVAISISIKILKLVVIMLDGAKEWMSMPKSPYGFGVSIVVLYPKSISFFCLWLFLFFTAVVLSCCWSGQFSPVIILFVMVQPRFVIWMTVGCDPLPRAKEKLDHMDVVSGFGWTLNSAGFFSFKLLESITT